MVLPLLPIAAGIAGAGVGAVAGGLTKKGASSTYAPQTTSQITDSRAYNIQYPTYQVQIDSPLAMQTTKKEATASAVATPTASQGVGGGTDLSILLPVALVIGGAMILKEGFKK
jgi:hypothetical protein